MEEESIKIDTVIEKVLSYSPDADVEVLKRAYQFSSQAHFRQKRLEGSPYIGHPLAVASILADMKMDVSTIVAGLLHDTIEDTSTTINDIKDSFGEEIAFLVEALTKLSKMQFTTKEDAQAENFRKMLLAMSEDIRVILIKFADRLHNMKTLRHLPESKKQRIASETIEIYAPLANRLGIGWLKAELEDLGFKILMPELYSDLVRKVAKRKEEQEKYLKEVTEIIEKKMKEEHIPGTVSGRIKHYYGIYQKMKNQEITFEQVHDVLGLRIITDTKANCYAILGIIHSLWTPIPGRFKDYIGVPKSNMYQSLHTTVIGPEGERVEFQIRTSEMHMVAEHGIASHWRYKEKGAVDERSDRYISWLRELIQAQKDLVDAKDFLEAVKGEVTPEVIYVFTPRGEIKELPIGSTPIDFAYSIHTEVGNRCVGAKVNDRIVSLKYTLKNGDTVEIITSLTHWPSRDWLKVVVTQRAKSKIKQWIKTEERKQSMELGIKMLEGEIRKHDLSMSVLKSEAMQDVFKFFNIKSIDDLYASVGFGKLSAHQIINKLMPEKPAEEIPIAKIVKPPKAKRGIIIKGLDNVLYHTAKCCYPIPGDGLVGYITRGKGVTIHRKDCPNLDRIAVDDARLVDVEWKTGGDMTSPVKLFMETIDRPGILATLSAVISSVNINISHIEASSTDDKKAHITFILEVKDKHQLSGLTQKIAQLEGVIRVTR
ncbi:MAG: bifunctional (p)ppGpp synthetase/guanosine-3',5'-bis(diphosphate) 3'-pyrophosphohydrolase [Nitrospirae bacterium]|jgi:GTP diphosphokinase / guanosine-3',5'-bis(diphosphate) 3'-diphosphatase|nr:bifunctional (p)ppGpp synthetase/guanosine-3',5'-bis(diphosphate) 3'-pyrophosphohydrolase [Nitrospirota bacterium]